LYDTVRLSSTVYAEDAAAHYFPISRASTIKLAFNEAYTQPTHTGMNFSGSEAINCCGAKRRKYFGLPIAVGTLEFRYLIGLNSFCYVLDYAGEKYSPGLT